MCETPLTCSCHDMKIHMLVLCNIRLSFGYLYMTSYGLLVRGTAEAGAGACEAGGGVQLLLPPPNSLHSYIHTNTHAYNRKWSHFPASRVSFPRSLSKVMGCCLGTKKHLNHVFIRNILISYPKWKMTTDLDPSRGVFFHLDTHCLSYRPNPSKCPISVSGKKCYSIYYICIIIYAIVHIIVTYIVLQDKHP